MLRSYVDKFSWPFSTVWQKFSGNRQARGNETKTPVEEETNVHVICLQTLFTWQNKTHSVVAVALTYIALWVLYWAACRPFYVVSAATLMWGLRDLWCNYIWPEISIPTARNQPSVLPKFRIVLGKELSVQLNTYVQNLVQLYNWAGQIRDDNHLLFSSVVSVILVFAAIVGYFIPGLVLAHLAFAFIWTTSCGMKLPSVLGNIQKSVVNFEDLVPSPSGDELQLLEKAREAHPLPSSSQDNASFLDLPSFPTIDDDDIISKQEVEEDLKFVPMHFEHGDLSLEDSINDFVPSTVREPEAAILSRQIMNLAGDVISRGRLALGLSTEPASDAEDFEILSHSDFES